MLRCEKIMSIKSLSQVVILILFLFSSTKSWSQALLQWNTFGNTGTETNEPSVYNDPNLSNSALTLGAGINPAANTNRLGGNSWATSLANAIAGNDYIEFTVAPINSCSVTTTAFIFNFQTSNAVFTTVTLRSSLDAFTTDIGSQAVTTTITQYTINISGITNNSSPITFRLYGYGTSVAGTTTGGFDISSNVINVQLMGTTSCSPSCTLPTTTLSASSQTVCSGTATTLSVSTNASSPSYTWQASANGASGWADVVNGTPSGVSYSGTNTAVLTLTPSSNYYYRILVSESGTCTATSATSTLVVNNAVSINAQPISVITTSTGIASYSATATGSGITYQWQQNSGSGFVNISNGGTNPTYAGATSSVLTISNPPLSMSGYSYQCIVSNACGTVTTNGTSTITVATSLTCPSITGALVNACDDVSCTEGNNEILFLNSGSYSIPVNSTNINIEFNGTNFTGSFTLNSTLTSNLNLAAGCSLFTDASSGTIPPNSSFVILNDDVCLNYNFASYCSSAPLYVIYSSGSWNSSGFFTNTGSTIRSWVTNFSSISATCPNATYSYIPDNLTAFGGSENGASVIFDNLGNPTYVNNGCNPPAILLPVDLIDFYATQDGAKNNLVWKIASESKVSQYIIEKSSDGVNFELLNTISPNEKNNYEIKIYQVIDYQPNSGINYYRLSTLEKDGLIYPIKTISISQKYNQLETLIYQNDEKIYIDFKNILDKIINIQLIDLTGKLLIEKNAEQSLEEIKVSEFSKGIYFIRIISTEKMINHKIIIQE